MYSYVSLKIDKIFPKYYITYFGLCKFLNNGYLFSNDAVFLGHPVFNPACSWGVAHKRADFILFYIIFFNPT